MAFWWLVVGLFLLVLFIWAILILARSGSVTRPQIIQDPQVRSIHRGGFDISIAMNMKGWVDYLVVPTSSLSGRNPDQISVKEIQWSNVIWGESELQVGDEGVSESRKRD